MQGHEIILKTGRIYEFEMACNALKEAGIPFFKQEEDYCGVKEAYYQPAMGPGIFFNLLVATPIKEEALKVISELPIEITQEPDFWHYGANEKSKRNWKIYALVILGISALALAINILKLIKKS
jgi:hypothetical protein